MDQLILYSLLTAVLIIATGPNRTVKLVYKPFGPNMCRELCQDSSHSIIYITEDLSCHLIPRNHPGSRQIWLKKDSFCFFLCTKGGRLVGRCRCCIDTPDTGTCCFIHKENLQRQAPYKSTDVTSCGNQRLLEGKVHLTLHQACKRGMLCIVKYILSRGLEDINCRGKSGGTPVMTAAGTGQEAVFDFLVSQGCDLSVTDHKKNNVLHKACLGGNIEIVRKLVYSEKYDIDCRGSIGLTPVMKAAFFGYSDVMEFLVSKGCNLTVVDEKGNNILHIACLAGQTDIVKYLLALNVISIESRGSGKGTPVMSAVERGHKDVFDLLVDKGCDLTVVDDKNNNLLHVACMGGHEDMVRHILSLNFTDIDSRGFHGRTPVMVSAEGGHRGVFDLLVSNDCNLTAVDDDKNNILHVACIGGNIEMVKHILGKKIVGIESRGICGRTAVMLAAETCHRRLFEVLVGKGCNQTAVDNDRNNILHVACIGGHAGIVEYIISQNISGIDCRGNFGRTPVMLAAGRGHRRVFELLVDKGCNQTAVDDHMNTILHVACIGGHVEMVEYIISQNISGIESRDSGGRTPVMTAAVRGDGGVFGLLTKSGCNLTVVDYDKNNILHVAALGGNVAIVKYLMTLEAVEGMEREKNKFGNTPFQMAKSLGHADIMSLFKEMK